MRKMALLTVACLMPAFTVRGDVGMTTPPVEYRYDLTLPEHNQAWYGPFLESLSVSLDESLDDRFNPQSVFIVWMSIRGDPRKVNDEYSDRITSSFARAFKRTGMDFGLNMPGAVRMHDWGEQLVTHFTDFYDRDRSDEPPTDPENRLMSLPWRRRLADGGTFFDYGFRPLNSSPYGFVTLSLRNREQTLADVYVRVRYRAPSGYRIETAVVYALTRHWYIGSGYSYEQDLRDGVEESNLTFRLERMIGRRSSAFVYASIRDGEHSVLAGVTRTF